jgi:hypothetical protein
VSNRTHRVPYLASALCALVACGVAAGIPTTARADAAATPPPSTSTDAGDHEARQSYPIAEDVATIDGIVRAYYEVVSGPAGSPRQWARDRSLHHPSAIVGVATIDGDGLAGVELMSLAEYHRRNEGLTETGFFEAEVHRETRQYGSIASVWSTYETRSDEDGPVVGRGINSIQLVHDGTRWWIVSWVYESERPDNELPDEYLPVESRLP